MGTFSRLRYVIAANMNAMIEKAENPEKLLRALIREMEDAAEDARLAAADLLAEQQHQKRHHSALNKEIQEWQQRAEKAISTDRDDLARTALQTKAELSEHLVLLEKDQAMVTERISELESDMNTLQGKLSDAKAKLKGMQRQQAPVAADKPHLQESPGQKKMRRALNRFDRLQTQVENLEARVNSYYLVKADDWKAIEEPADPAIEDELEQLKAKLAPASKKASTKSNASTEQA